MLHKIYRFCDRGEGRTKIDTITKRQCFLNFIEVFGTERLTVVADNTHPETIEFLRGFDIKIHQTALGNSGSFRYALDLALALPEKAAVYMVEDDYLHQPGSETLIREGLEMADYVSLYDHPDKYMDPSPNPLVKQGGEATRVLLTRSSHWKLTNSTTMTFATRVRILRQDAEVMRKYCRTPIPQDFFMFCELLKRGRRLVTPIPGRSTHCDHFPSPFIFDTPSPLDGNHRLEVATGGSGSQVCQAEGEGIPARITDRNMKLQTPVPVIIPFYRREDQLDKCLAALKQQTWPVEIFIRNNSEDNIFFTAAVNEGLRRYMDRPFDFALVLNQDMYLAPKAVETMVQFMEAHPKCGIGAPLQLDVGNPDRVICAGGYEAFPAGRHQGGLLADFQEDTEILWANGACMMLRKAMIREIGLLDENLIFICSDSDYSFTARSRGWQVWRIAGAHGIHEHGASGKVSNLEIEKLKLGDLLRFGRKWLTGGLYGELAHEKDPLPEQAGVILEQIQQTQGLLQRYIDEGWTSKDVLDGNRLCRPEELKHIFCIRKTN